MVEDRRHCHSHHKSRSRGDVGRNLQRFPGILQREFLSKLEYAVLPADADILLNVLCSNPRNAFRQALEHLVSLDGYLAKVSSRIFAKQGCSLRIYCNASGPKVCGYPFRHLVIPHLRGIQHEAVLLHILVQASALVRRGPVHQNHQNRGFQRFGSVCSEILQRLHVLGLLEHHQTPLGHHRVTPCIRGYSAGIRVQAVIDRLVEIPFGIGQGMPDDLLTKHVRIIRFVPHQKIDGGERTIPYVLNSLAALFFNSCKTFGH